jgi:hypothetical protein
MTMILSLETASTFSAWPPSVTPMLSGEKPRLLPEISIVAIRSCRQS